MDGEKDGIVRERVLPVPGMAQGGSWASAREPGSWGWRDQRCFVQRMSVQILGKGNKVTLLAVCLTSFAKQALENGAKSLGKLIEKLWGEM